MTEIILIMTLVCSICRAIMFYKRDIKWIYAFIPGINTYKLGKTVGCKKLAITNGIMSVLFWVYFFLCFYYEIWIMKNFAYSITMPTEANELSRIEVNVPVNVANIAIYSKYILIIFAVVTLILWCIMMWKFTMKHNKSPWWILLWAFMPVIPYIYFAVIPYFVNDGKQYTMQKVEITE